MRQTRRGRRTRQAVGQARKRDLELEVSGAGLMLGFIAALALYALFVAVLIYLSPEPPPR